MKQVLDYLAKFKGLNTLIYDHKDIHCENNESFAFYLYYKFINSGRKIFVVMENLLSCQNLYNDLFAMLPNKVFMYSVDEIVKYSSIATSMEMASSRIYTLNKILNDEPAIIISHTMAVKRIVPSPLTFKKNCFTLKMDDEESISSIINKLVKIGYKNVYKVTQPFEFSSRGGVIDIFSINYDNPIRIEFFDTIVDSIRFFDIESQRTINSINEVKIIPASEFLIDDLEGGIKAIEEFAKPQINNSVNNLKLESVINEEIERLRLYDFDDALFKYYSFFNCHSSLALYLENYDVLFVNKEKIFDNEIFHEEEISEDLAIISESGESLVDFSMFNSIASFINSLIRPQFIEISIENQINDLSFSKVESFDFNFETLYKELVELELEHYTIYIGIESEVHFESLKAFFEANNVRYYQTLDDMPLKEGINLSRVDLKMGLKLTDYKLYVIGEKEIFNKKFKTAISQFSRYKNAITLSSVNDLDVGDYLVHEHYGIGIYRGIETMLTNGLHRDYLKIAYKNEDILYLPLEQFKLVRKFVSKEGATPKINKLGSKEWEKTKAKINERVNEIAAKLVNLYSLRAKNTGFAFAKDDDLQESFEGDFPYALTKDQAKVLKEIKDDMESSIIMDRLLVGDVGFGKTEIAFRAAFKAINSGKQVAMLCPTTLLASQHHKTAIERFKNFGVRIAIYTRYVTEKESKKILSDLIEGKLDLIIGTHRLLSKDIKFKDLGLLIIDEEHKFGVEHKEKIKEFKQSVDVLTLSATPIPRTLQMALTGVRCLSTINTPIDDRMPVQTYVIKKSLRSIKEIIERELARGGQVYYLNNRIEALPRIANEIKSVVKNARIAIAHGQMGSENMEDIMQQFINKEYDVLLCTTIIENGIDIENANTIIVENADHFGLSQLYQIKGRVGRSNKIAYAYLMYQPNKELSDIATKRLSTIKEFTSLGSGYKVAMRDLVTRGAGDLLGPEQSGFIETVGIDMYIDMLNNAINRQKALANGEEIKEEKIKPNQMIGIDAYIPEKYFNNDFEKIDLYKRIDKIKDIDELNSLKEEIIDETGKLPESINMLFEKKIIDIYESKNVIESYQDFNDYVLIKLDDSFLKYNGVGIELFDEACKISNLISLKFNANKIECHVKKKDNFLYIISSYVKALSKIKKKHEER